MTRLPASPGGPVRGGAPARPEGAATLLRRFGPQDAAWVVERHAALYAWDEGFDARFEADVAEVVARHVAAPHPDDRGWIAAAGAGSGESSGTERRLGCIFCMRQDAHTARLRLFLVEPDWRGTGLARRLLAACLAHARARGYDRMALTTHDSHRAACRLYEKAGFERGPAVPTRSYGRDLHVVPFTKALRAGPSGLASRAGRS